jgi:hypothetical protein
MGTNENAAWVNAPGMFPDFWVVSVVLFWWRVLGAGCDVYESGQGQEVNFGRKWREGSQTTAGKMASGICK